MNASPKVSLYRTHRPTKDRPRRHVWQLRWVADGERLCDTIGEAGDLIAELLDGTKRFRAVPGMMTEREADRIQRDRQGKIDNRITPATKPERLTLKAFETFHAEIARGEISAGSMLNVGYSFAWARKVLGDDVQIATIGASHISRIRNAMLDKGKAAPTIHKTLAYMRAAFNRAKAHKLIHENPFLGFTVKNADKAKAATIRTREEIRAIKAAAANDSWRALVGLWFTGMREEEAVALKWSDIDLARGEVHIRQCDAATFTVKDKDGNDVAYPVLAWQAKTTRSYRTVPVGADTIAALRAIAKQSDGSTYAFIDLPRLRAIQAMQKVGTWAADNRLVNNLRRDFQVLQRKALGKDAALCTIHDCRKSFITNALAAGEPVQDVAAVVGDSEAVVLKYYAKVRPGLADRVRALTDDGPVLKLAG